MLLLGLDILSSFGLLDLAVLEYALNGRGVLQPHRINARIVRIEHTVNRNAASDGEQHQLVELLIGLNHAGAFQHNALADELDRGRRKDVQLLFVRVQSKEVAVGRHQQHPFALQVELAQLL